VLLKILQNTPKTTMLAQHRPNMESAPVTTRKLNRLPAFLRDLAPPPDSKTGYRMIRDPATRRLFLRVTKAGAKAWVHVGGRSFTIGSFDDWPYELAREEAHRLNRLVDQGIDPHTERDARKTAPTVAELVEEWRKDIDSKVPPKIRPSSRAEYEMIIRQWILPELAKRFVADVDRADVEALHRKVTHHGTPVRANRVVALVSRLFRTAVDLQWRTDNPASRVERNHEEPRYVALSSEELERLLAGIPQCKNKQSARAIELILLTGSRRNEVLRMEWSAVDLRRGTWTKAPTSTKQRRLHHIPLNTLAQQILAEIRTEAEARAAKYGREVSRWVFPAKGRVDQPIQEIKQAWAGICRRAGLSGVNLHDCRHIYGSFLASSGVSLYIVGQLLGHSRSETTRRYAHLAEDPLREQAERWGAAVAAAKASQSGAVIKLASARRTAS
jgi:integrase